MNQVTDTTMLDLFSLPIAEESRIGKSDWQSPLPTVPNLVSPNKALWDVIVTLIARKTPYLVRVIRWGEEQPVGYTAVHVELIRNTALGYNAAIREAVQSVVQAYLHQFASVDWDQAEGDGNAMVINLPNGHWPLADYERDCVSSGQCVASRNANMTGWYPGNAIAALGLEEKGANDGS